MTDELRKQLQQLVDDGDEARRSLARLAAVDKAASSDATLADVKAAAAECDAVGDFESAGRFKDEWINRLQRGEQ